MKLFRIRGGVHPEERKDATADKAIESLPLPDLLHVPLQQHIGVPAEPEVQRGDYVKKGQLLARFGAAISASVHAPTSGKVLGVGPHPAPHPSGLPVRTIVIKPDGNDEWGELMPAIDDPFAVAPELIAERVAEAGIVGMGGATFPSAVKLNLRHKYDLHTLVINGAECEPYLTADDRLMRERTDKIIDGARIMGHALGVGKVVIAIETNKPKALAAMRTAAVDFDEVQVIGVPTRYPMGSEKHLVQTLTGIETPGGGLTADIGVVVHNVATAFAVFEAVRLGRPLLSRVVTVSGGAVREPRNLEVLIGTSVSALLDYCRGFTEEPARLVLGGPMMGQPLPDTEVPVVKGANGILALTEDEVRTDRAMPCIRCGTCVTVCPCGLLPLEMVARVRKEELDSAVKFGLQDCLSCGSCAYACPSHIPMVQYFNYAKGRLKALEQEKRQQEVTKRLAEQREERLQREKEAKKKALEARKKAAAAKKKKDAEAKGEAKPEDKAEDKKAEAKAGKAEGAAEDKAQDKAEGAAEDKSEAKAQDNSEGAAEDKPQEKAEDKKAEDKKAEDQTPA